MKKVLIIMIALALSLSFGGVVKAQQELSAPLQVTAEILPVGEIGTAPVNFYGDAGIDLYADGVVYVKCSSGVPYDITLDAGYSYDGTSRRVQRYPYYLSYYLYKDTALSEEWGDSGYANTYPAGLSLAGTGNGQWQSHTVYGKLIGDPAAPPGRYSDVVTATVYF